MTKLLILHPSLLLFFWSLLLSRLSLFPLPLTSFPFAIRQGALPSLTPVIIVCTVRFFCVCVAEGENKK